MNDQGLNILFVCLGNTCRSPMAEAIFKSVLKERGLKSNWSVGSAGIEDWHRGNKPNQRSVRVLQEHNVPITHIARQIAVEDFFKNDIIFGMDFWNMEDLNAIAPINSKAKLEPFGAYDPKKELQIRDPYCDIGMGGFYQCFEQCVRCTNGFLDKFEKY